MLSKGALKKILIIQTAFIGDVILATPLIEKLRAYFPDAKIDFLVRKGNENLLANNPCLNSVLVWDKKKNKFFNLLKMLFSIRESKYDLVINVQRFFSTGLLAVFSGAKETIGFDKNPLSFLFGRKVSHIIGTREKPMHEAERNLKLIEHLTDDSFVKPKLYPSQEDFEKIKINDSYVCIAPTSVWFTKQLPAKKWLELIGLLDKSLVVCLMGGKEDAESCERIKRECKRDKVINLAGKMSLLQSAALMKNAVMNYVNDSAPLHLASAVNAPVTAVFCSTVPAFGFTPLSDKSKVVETKLALVCRPCGTHGYRACPQKHFRCAEIEVKEIV